MTRTEQIAEAFELLRSQCDPRGHALLNALENLCLVESYALEMFLLLRRCYDLNKKSNSVKT